MQLLLMFQTPCKAIGFLRYDYRNEAITMQSGLLIYRQKLGEILCMNPKNLLPEIALSFHQPLIAPTVMPFTKCF